MRWTTQNQRFTAVWSVFSIVFSFLGANDQTGWLVVCAAVCAP